MDYVKDFREWATFQTNRVGKLFEPKSISNYNSSLNTLLKKLDLTDTYTTVYDCRDYAEFKVLNEKIRALPKFVVENKATNSTHSSALDLYERYLKYLKCKELDITSKADYDKQFEDKESKAQGKSISELSKKVKEKKKDSVRERTVYETIYDRDPDVAAYVKIRANGICDLCNQPAPFIKSDGLPYLESHHIKWLSEGGEDTVDNAVALCANCHRKMHSLKLKEDIDILVEKIKKYKKEA